MTVKGAAPGARKPSMAEERSEGEAPSEPRDLLSALDSAPEEMDEPEEDGATLDAEQLDLAQQMGMDKTEALALRRFIESIR